MTDENLFERFSRVFSFYLPESHRDFYSQEDLRIFLQARFDFFSRVDEEIKLRIFNPDESLFWLVNSSIIELSMPDSPFIVDTILDYCNAHDYRINLIVHPILQTRRNSAGEMQSVDHANGASGAMESYVYMEISRRDEAQLKVLHAEIMENLQDLRTIVTDYDGILPVINDLQIQDEELAREREWLKANFVILGMFRSDTNERLGLLRKDDLHERVLSELARAPDTDEKPSGESILYRETSIASSVNHNRYLYIARLVTGDRTIILLGHFARRARNAMRNDIPGVKRKILRLCEDLRAAPASHLRKEIDGVGRLLPVEILLTRDYELLRRMFTALIANTYVNEAEFQMFIDEDYGLLWILGTIPSRDSGQIPGARFEDFKSEFKATVRFEIRNTQNRNEVLLMAVESPEKKPEEMQTYLEGKRDEVFTSWSSRFRKLVANKYIGDSKINDKLKRYFEGMSPAHELLQEPSEALFDLDRLESLEPEDGFSVHFFRESEGRDFIKIYSLTATALSDLVPVLTNFGFKILGEQTYPFLDKRTSLKHFIYSFRVPHRDLNRDDRRRVAVAIALVLNGGTSSNPVNALVPDAGLTADELRLTKALLGYFYQFDKSHSRLSLQWVLLKYGKFAAALIKLFHARFRTLSGQAGENSAPDASEIETANQAVEAAFAELESALDESICRVLLSIVRAVQRTNFYLGRDEISFKVKSGEIESMPRPLPLYEIYMHGYHMEGVHLRGGMVARGGLRWSDRNDDFRTEILGLMKAQMVKNTLIVPVGSKGGFVIKNRTFADRKEFQENGVQTYKRFITNLLELTDNRDVQGNVVPAAGIRRLDGDDPYLVVAADKGTATFSDIANEISEGRNFWLADAFASGGQNGYDHKKQGITARGAWESVRRHFHEMEINPDADPVTVAAIGDMGGDVFGNGMLISSSIKLTAAFNHRHIFLDPDPDPAVSHQERRRLFDKTAGWDEYDEKLISQGGGVFDRNSREINLSPQIRERLGVEARSMSGEELMRAILKAPVDLLWNGGIGTYVKSEQESHFQAGDPANDRVRVNGNDLRARVIGEGGNLGLTQAGRVEASAAGVRLNTDAVDNSAGVDMSDHEVNLKILLTTLQRKQVIKSDDERNGIIRRYDSDEIDLVLAHNYSNNLALSLDYRRVPNQFTDFRGLIKLLNREGLINREQDSIPFEVDLDRLEQEGNRRLLRPVLCSLMGFTKLYIADLFLNSDEFHDDWYDRYVLRYFPAGLVEDYEEDIRTHPLKREIVITEIVNDVINHAGIAYFQRMGSRTDADPVRIAVTYMQVSEFLNPGVLRGGLGEEWPSAELHYAYLIRLEEKIARINGRLLRDGEAISRIKAPGADAEFRAILEEAGNINGFRMPKELKALQRALPKDKAETTLIAFRRVDVLEDAYNIFFHGNGKAWNTQDYFQALETYRVNDLRRIVAEMTPASQWETLFLTRIDEAVEELVPRILTAGPDEAGLSVVATMVEDMLALANRGALSAAAFHEMLQHLDSRVLRS